MSNYVLLFLISILLVLSSLIIFLILLQYKQLNQKDRQIQNLLNRLMSQDIQTFQRLEMTNSQNIQAATKFSDTPQVSMSDTAEAERFAKMHGLGEAIYTEDPMSETELQDMFKDLGMEIKDD